MIRETTKATLHRHLNSYTPHQWKGQESNSKSLEKKITSLQEIHKNSDSYKSVSRCNSQTKYGLFLSHAEATNFLAKEVIWIWLDYSSHIPNHPMKNQNNDKSVNMIRILCGAFSCDPLIIYITFREFYKSLFSSKKTDSNIASYLNNNSVPPSRGGSLQITPEEVWTVVQPLSNGRCLVQTGVHLNSKRWFGQRFSQLVCLPVFWKVIFHRLGNNLVSVYS